MALRAQALSAFRVEWEVKLRYTVKAQHGSLDENVSVNIRLGG